MHILSGHFVKFIIIFIIKTSVLLSRVLGKKWHFCSVGLCRCSIVCMPFLWRYFNVVHWSAMIGLLTKSATFFLAPDYGQWITTQNVREKILHALHFKWKISRRLSNTSIAIHSNSIAGYVIMFTIRLLYSKPIVNGSRYWIWMNSY